MISMIVIGTNTQNIKVTIMIASQMIQQTKQFTAESLVNQGSSGFFHQFLLFKVRQRLNTSYQPGKMIITV